MRKSRSLSADLSASYAFSMRGRSLILSRYFTARLLRSRFTRWNTSIMRSIRVSVARQIARGFEAKISNTMFYRLFYRLATSEKGRNSDTANCKVS